LMYMTCEIFLFLSQSGFLSLY